MKATDHLGWRALATLILVAGAGASAPVSASALPPDPPAAVQIGMDLGRLRVRAHTSAPYDRVAQFGGWTSQSGCTTRQCVLLRDGLRATAGDRCAVTATHWRSLYDGRLITQSSRVQIDHIVPLGNAWRSGASSWTRTERVRFANDLTDPELVTSSAQANQAKGDSGPERWRPSRPAVWCLYARWWVNVKTVWRLTVTRDERHALRSMLTTC